MYKLVCVILLFLDTVYSEKIISCYYSTWATYRPGNGKFDVENINVDLCTHVIYAFVGINDVGTVISLDPYLDLPDNNGRNNFGKFVALKQRKQNLKTILAVGGWNEGSAKYSIMAANPSYRRNFISSAIDLLLRFGFDGFDIDWEYPNTRDTVHGVADINNFTQLLRELREEFNKHGLLLTIATSSVRAMASLSYDIAAISRYVDIIGIMTYDMYGSWNPITGHNAPLHRGEGDYGPIENFNTVDVAVQYWLQQGCPPQKLTMGLPMYGRTFLLTDAWNNGVRAPSSGAGIAGPYTDTNGIIGYNELCTKFLWESWQLRYDNLAKVPYAVQNRNWISYDDSDSLIEKVNYANNYNLAGVMIWSIETDDFHGLCHGIDFPLLRAINRVLRASTVSTIISTLPPSTSVISTTSASTTAASTLSSSLPTGASSPSSTLSTVTTTVSTNTVATSSNSTTVSPSTCQKEGIMANPDDDYSFILCVVGDSAPFFPYYLKCPYPLKFDKENLVCGFTYKK